MAALDRVMQLQSQGMNDAQISAQLMQEGVSAAEINDSLNQARIKNAVSPPMPAAPDPSQNMQMPAAPEVYPPMAPQAPTAPMPMTPDPYAMQQQYAQDPYQGQQGYQGQQQYAQDYYGQASSGYSNQEGYYEGGGMAGSENVSEIAEQVATQKLNEYKQKVGDVASFINNATDKINDLDDRLKRIENSIDKLQQAIIGKIGEFGESSAMIHKDLENLHGTVGKLMNPLMDSYNELKKLK